MRRVVVVTASKVVYGAELLMLSNVAPLAQRGYAVAFIGPDRAELASEADGLGAPFTAITLSQHHGLRNSDGEGRPSPLALIREMVTTLSNAWTIRRELPSDSIVHSNSGALHLSTALAARSRRLPVVVHLHDLVRPGMGRRLLGLIVGLATTSIAISEAVAACVPDKQRSKVHLVGNGIDVATDVPVEDLRAELGLDPAAVLVAYVARFHPNKRQRLLVEAWSAVVAAHPHAHLVLVGGPDPVYAEYFDEVRQFATGIDSISFLGRREDVGSILANTAILVHPAKAEPFGLTVVEAMAAGCAVLVSRSGGAIEVIEDGVSGLTFEPGNAEDLVDRLSDLLGDDGRRSALADAGRCRALSHYTLDQHVDDLAAVYQSLPG
ncbi:MAG: glycosyltransferase family 4 protein [Actinomycetia bacterium]|nr:glycosyltransferase family 4 protein [Actinomycetes bacterium]MCP4960680.1 glycosyltransferase family 4 protein [Actinomycetes bacterium]